MISSDMSIGPIPELAVGDQQPQLSRITNLSISFLYTRQLAGKFYLSSGIEFYNRGSRIMTDTLNTEYGGAIQDFYKNDAVELLSYMAVPLIATRQFTLGRHGFNLHAGISASYLLSAKAKGEAVIVKDNMWGYPPPTVFKYPLDATQYGYRKWDFSVLFGGGYLYKLNEDLALGAEYRYTLNSRNINGSRYVYVSSDGKYYTPEMKNKENHTLSLAVYLGPGIFRNSSRQQK